MFSRLSTALRQRFASDHVVLDDLVIPARHLRRCGAEFQDDQYFVESARLEASKLMDLCDLTVDDHVLDVGCGPGRLAVGWLAGSGHMPNYHGMDINKASIDWCVKHLAPLDARLKFSHLDLFNERYNPTGQPFTPTTRLPYESGFFQGIYLYSVFSHMTSSDIRIYLREFARLLVPGGRVFLTAFVEPDVPDEEENPPGYGLDWHGSLHCVRFDKEYFENMVEAAGLHVVEFRHGTETNGQSALLLALQTPSGTRTPS